MRWSRPFLSLSSLLGCSRHTRSRLVITQSFVGKPPHTPRPFLTEALGHTVTPPGSAFARLRPTLKTGLPPGSPARGHSRVQARMVGTEAEALSLSFLGTSFLKQQSETFAGKGGGFSFRMPGLLPSVKHSPKMQLCEQTAACWESWHPRDAGGEGGGKPLSQAVALPDARKVQPPQDPRASRSPLKVFFPPSFKPIISKGCC